MKVFVNERYMRQGVSYITDWYHDGWEFDYFARKARRIWKSGFNHINWGKKKIGKWQKLPEEFLLISMGKEEEQWFNVYYHNCKDNYASHEIFSFNDDDLQNLAIRRHLIGLIKALGLQKFINVRLLGDLDDMLYLYHQKDKIRSVI